MTSPDIRSSRSITDITNELNISLNNNSSATYIRPIVKDLERKYKSVYYSSMPIQNEAAAATTLCNILRQLSDPRISSLGMYILPGLRIE